MTRVAMVLHRERREAVELAEQASSWLVANGHEAWIVDRPLGVPGTPTDQSRPASEADLVLSLGGDGTMLRAVRLIDGSNVPLIGVNLGQLGYLSEVESHDMVAALERFLSGQVSGGWTIDERMMLEVTAYGADGVARGSWRVLNEVSVERASAGESIRLLLHIDGAPFTTYATDGLIVSTPTGSTAYAFSARGPVVSPRHRALLVTPVAPHQLFDRSLVLDPSESVQLEMLGHRSAALVADGLTVASLEAGASVTCRPAGNSANFIRFGPLPYHQILKAKFGLTDR